MFYFFKPIALFNIKCRNNIPFPHKHLRRQMAISRFKESSWYSFALMLRNRSLALNVRYSDSCFPGCFFCTVSIGWSAGLPSCMAKTARALQLLPSSLPALKTCGFRMSHSLGAEKKSICDCCPERFPFPTSPTCTLFLVLWLYSYFLVSVPPYVLLHSLRTKFNKILTGTTMCPSGYAPICQLARFPSKSLIRFLSSLEYLTGSD